jgi:hypothetical protein
MFIAVCSFDKSITIFDFFSGDLVAQVSGHSELITNIKFSPDGRRLISVAGDGCVFVWTLSEMLVTAMEERLKELYTSAQKKQMKLSQQLERLPSGSADQDHSVMPPPPPPGPTASSSPPTAAAKLHPSIAKHRDSRNLARNKDSGTGSEGVAPAKDVTGLEVVGSSLSGTGKLRLGAKKAAGDPAPAAGSNVSGSTPPRAPVAAAPSVAAAKVNQSRWAARNSNEGYELFGRKVLPSSDAKRNSFTLELDSDENAASIASAADSEPHPADESNDDDVDRALGLMDQKDEGLASSTKLAMNLEATDDVMLHVSDDEDEDDDGDDLFKPQDEAHSEDSDDTTDRQLIKNKFYMSGSDANNSSSIALDVEEHLTAHDESDAEDDLDRTSSKLESLERSARNLESWLEDVVCPHDRR